MSRFNVAKVINSVPASPEPNTVYFVRKDEGFDLYVTNSDGVIVPRALNADIQAAILEADLEALSQVVDTKVDKVEGQSLMLDSERTKLSGIAAGAQVNTVNSVAGKTGAVTLSKADVGLSNVDNTNDLNKPVSTATQNALNTKLNASEVGSTVASLVGGKVPLSQINDSIIGQVEYMGIWNAATNSPTLPATPTEKGHYYVTSVAGTFQSIYFEVGDWIISNGVSWDKVDNTDAVSSVAGKTGVVTLTKTDVGLGNVDNTSDANKPVSTAQQTVLNTKVDKVEGKQLSTNDFTDAEKTKLSGIANNANNYVHPNSGVSAGTYKSVTVNAQGHVTGGSNPSTLSGYGITDAAPSSHVGSTGSAHGVATPSVAGFMSAADKLKLDGISDGAGVPSVTSVAGKQGAVTLVKGDVGLGNVDNTSDINKPISTATQNALNSKVTNGTTVTFGSTNTFRFTSSGGKNYVQSGDGSGSSGWSNLVFSPYMSGDVYGEVTPNGFVGGGAGLTNLNASNLTTGTVDDARLPATMSAKTFNGGEVKITNTTDALRIVNGNYGTFWRQDGSSLYLMVTASGDQYGTWTSARPIQVNLSTGSCDINGRSATATKLQTARTIALTGGVTGSATFDGSANVSISATVANNSHSHTIANVTGLQAALDGKAASTDSRIINGQTAYGWGDHAQAGYVTVNTTYSAMSVAEGDAGSATTLRTMRSDYLRQIISKIPSVPQSVAYVATAADRGKGIDTTAAVTIPADTFNVGDVLVITNVGAGEFNISPDTGVILRVAGTTDTGVVTLGAYGVVTLRLVSTNTWFVMGAGIK